jgi:hypothetical protein
MGAEKQLSIPAVAQQDAASFELIRCGRGCGRIRAPGA